MVLNGKGAMNRVSRQKVTTSYRVVGSASVYRQRIFGSLCFVDGKATCVQKSMGRWMRGAQPCGGTEPSRKAEE
jgi:hypothetical protein